MREGDVPSLSRSAEAFGGFHTCRHRLSINIEGFEALNWGKRLKNGGEMVGGFGVGHSSLSATHNHKFMTYWSGM